MASDNETVADIVREMVEFGNHCAAFGGAYSPERWDNLCKRLNAAHKRALAAKDAEIAELQRRFKEAEEFAAEMKESINSLVRACGHQMILRLQGEGGNDEK